MVSLCGMSQEKPIEHNHGFSVAGFDKDQAKVEALRREAQQRDARGAADIHERIDAKGTFHTEWEKS